MTEDIEEMLLPENRQLLEDAVAGLIAPHADELYEKYIGDNAMLGEYAKMTVSDWNQKRVKALAADYGRRELTPEEMQFLFDESGASDIDAGSVDGSLLDKYAEHIRNYLYTYKPEAAAIDPSIDPDEPHIGPMAQDIEKVAPDCVKETSGGTKVVDGSRLALVNAGTIADLARRILSLEHRIGA